MESEKGELPTEQKKDRKVAIFGIGATGSVIVQELQKMGIFSQIICLDNNPDRAKKFILDWSKITLIKSNGNGNSEKLLNKLEGISLLINSASSELNIKLMKIAWELGCYYLDLASFGDVAAEQKGFNDRFVKKGIIGLINFGVGPGLTNLMAAELIKGLKHVSIRIFVAEQTETDETIFLWNPKLLFNEATSPVPYFGNGEEKKYPPRQAFTEPEWYCFPQPLGRLECVIVNQNEGLTFQDLPNVWRVQVKLGGSDIKKAISLLRKKKGSQERLRKLIRNVPLPPTPDEISEMIKNGVLRDGRMTVAVEVSGIDSETEKEIQRRAFWQGISLLEIQKECKGKTQISYPVGYLASLGAEIIVRSNMIMPGVWAPEQLPEEERHFIFEKLATRQMPVRFE